MNKTLKKKQYKKKLFNDKIMKNKKIKNYRKCLMNFHNSNKIQKFFQGKSLKNNKNMKNIIILTNIVKFNYQLKYLH